jgi:peptide-methionine (R)-S-oxide reductase
MLLEFGGKVGEDITVSMTLKSTSLTVSLSLALFCALELPVSNRAADSTNSPTKAWNMKDKVVKTPEEWKKQLTPEQFRVLRNKGTDRAFTGELWNNHQPGIYRCAGCGLEVFSADTKFESGTGWPSFYQPIEPSHVGTEADNSLFSRRTEVHCARCGGHLGHVFEDGPKPTGLRYCINSAALKFEKK